MTTATDARAALTVRLSSDLDGAFSEVVGSYRQAVYTTALRMSGRPVDAADLAAEAFLRAYQALRGYPPERIRELQLRPWLVTIVLNLWRNQVRTASRRPAQVPLDSSPEPRAPSGGPEEHLRRRELRSVVEDLLAELPETQRLSVVLRHIVGLSFSETAAVLGCPEGTAKSHVSRGLARLRVLIADTNLEEELT
ncbi:MAG TPA: sigma-70 family RNA polymerase sigma factor [Acidimicrobiales bacterium]|jgi:RNA polymerase sigma-70 factor (ECF subfamily)|nr:sigma-70 family RNA polymerase sigma factor [Acidimicrobiales bacterium]